MQCMSNYRVSGFLAVYLLYISPVPLSACRLPSGGQPEYPSVERKKPIPKYTFRGLFIYLSACVYVFGSVIDRDVRESEKFTALLQVTYVFQYSLIYIYMNETAMPQR